MNRCTLCEGKGWYYVWGRDICDRCAGTGRVLRHGAPVFACPKCNGKGFFEGMVKRFCKHR